MLPPLNRISIRILGSEFRFNPKTKIPVEVIANGTSFILIFEPGGNCPCISPP